MKVCFHGFQENVASFEVSGTVSKGDPVKVSANGTVAACAAGDKFCGIALSVRDGIAAVQLAGYVRVPVSGAVSAGYQTHAAAGEGAVKAAETGRELLVIDADSAECGILL